MESNSYIYWTTPVLRWAGSKRKLLPHLLAQVPDSARRYIEPFAGSACLFFALRPEQAVLGDINADLIEAYRVIREHPRLVARAVHEIPGDSRTYYKVRSMNVSSMKPIARVARFVYLNRRCFNGVYRVNRSGRFNVPRGTRTGDLPSESHFFRCAFALRHADLRAGDYHRCLVDIRKNDFVYLDPPYASRRRNTHGEYGYGCFTEKDMPAMIDSLRRIDSMGASFLLSYSLHSTLDRLPRHWRKRELLVRRHVAGFALNRRRVREVLISNRELTGI